MHSKAGPEAKEVFVKAIIRYVNRRTFFEFLLSSPSSSRSLKRTRDAAQQFMLVARGLEGSSFGHATVSM